jgi:hypothetical protein
MSLLVLLFPFLGCMQGQHCLKLKAQQGVDLEERFCTVELRLSGH